MNSKTIVPRHVRKGVDQPGMGNAEPLQALDTFRDAEAWVLLGEPGAGKTSAFEIESQAVGGQFIRVAEFIQEGDPDPEWRDKILFLDGLDEVRGGGATNVLIRIRSQLRKLGKPRFRLACRAADWYGATDTEDLKGVSPDGQLTKLFLEPLTSDEIGTILHDNLGVADPPDFMAKADERGLGELLSNPQTLELLAGAVAGGQWPRSRDDTYRLACDKLAAEANKRHRDNTRSQSRSKDLELLPAAGQLCAVLLLSNKTGIALDPSAASAGFPNLDGFRPPHKGAARVALKTKLFRPELGREERLVPVHRTIAEYLASRWIADRIDQDGYPLRRLLTLLLGADGGVVAGLRGLFGWLALHCISARTRLIDADPLATVLYGDVKPMPVADKRRILAGLRREAERFSAFRREARTTLPFGALADEDLREDFRSILAAPERDDADQAMVDCVLDVLEHGELKSELQSDLLAAVRDETRWVDVRTKALRLWLRTEPTLNAALELLRDVSSGVVADPRTNLIGTLLNHLYPAHMAPSELLKHLHAPIPQPWVGVYSWFWSYAWFDQIPDGHLPTLLDELAGRTGLWVDNEGNYGFRQSVDEMLARGLEIHGDDIEDARLYRWLGIGADQYGELHRDPNASARIAGWLSARPERYRAVLNRCYESCGNDSSPQYCVRLQSGRLCGAAPPDTLGIWHLEQVEITESEDLAQQHLYGAVDALIKGQGTQGLSLETLETWAGANPKRREWLKPLLCCAIPEWRTRIAAKAKTDHENRKHTRQERAARIASHLPAIRCGAASDRLLHQLASIWTNYELTQRHKSLVAHFTEYYENGDEVLSAARAGFRLCPEREGIPSVAEIISTYLDQHAFLIGLPCLLGMELRGDDGIENLESLGDDTLARMLAFRFTQGMGDTPEWFRELVRTRPGLVVDVLIQYARAVLHAGNEYVASIYPLADNSEYQDVARLAAPALLASFPVRSRVNQLQFLDPLLRAAMRYAPDDLRNLIERKILLKSMDVAQKVYWYAAGLLLDPVRYESNLWKYVGDSEARIGYLTGFLLDSWGNFNQDYELSPKTLGRLIESITPHAEINPSQDEDEMTVGISRGEQVRGMIGRLSTVPTDEATREIERLLTLDSTRKIKFHLQRARHEQIQKRREAEFLFLSPSEAAQTLANKEPANNADLAALTLDHLDDIARAIRTDNDDGFRAFWNVINKRPTRPREENLCRDVLLTRFRARLLPQGVDCQPEGDNANDKRADLRVSYGNALEIPIEIKRDNNSGIWSALYNQLKAKYSIAPRADGYGIYLVLWFGGKMPTPLDGQCQPRSPKELQSRLEATVDAIDRNRLFVRVIDVSWPE